MCIWGLNLALAPAGWQGAHPDGRQGGHLSALGGRPRRASRRPPRRAYQRIIVGDVSSWRLAKGSIAKSVLDAGWGMLNVSERCTTQTRSSCKSRSEPKGVSGLNVGYGCAVNVVTFMTRTSMLPSCEAGMSAPAAAA